MQRRKRGGNRGEVSEADLQVHCLLHHIAARGSHMVGRWSFEPILCAPTEGSVTSSTPGQLGRVTLGSSKQVEEVSLEHMEGAPAHTSRSPSYFLPSPSSPPPPSSPQCICSSAEYYMDILYLAMQHSNQQGQ